MNTYRRLLAEAISNNGGYSRTNDSYPLEWSLPVMPDKTTFSELYPLALQRLKEDFGIDAPHWTNAAIKHVEGDWDMEIERDLYYNIIGDMQSSLTDGDTFKTMRPEIEKRYGLGMDPLVAKLHKARNPHWKNPLADGIYFNVKWEFAGRGSKHLVLTEFEGRTLEGLSARGLASAILEDTDGSYTNNWCLNLLAMVHEWDLCFTREAAEEEWDHAASYRLAQRLSEAHEDRDENALELSGLAELFFTGSEVQLLAVDQKTSQDVVVFMIPVDDDMPEPRAMKLGNIYKEALEAHLAQHG